MEATDSLWQPLKGKAERERRRRGTISDDSENLNTSVRNGKVLDSKWETMMSREQVEFFNLEIVPHILSTFTYSLKLVVDSSIKSGDGFNIHLKKNIFLKKSLGLDLGLFMRSL